MKPFFNQLFDYNFYCNKNIIESFSELEKIPEKCSDLFCHILNAHHIWNQRILQEGTKYGVWHNHDFEKWGDIHYDNQRTSFEIITNAEDFDKRITYETTEKGVYTNTLHDILFHIVNHSTHHRGQILLELRANGIDPKPLDYIFFKR